MRFTLASYTARSHSEATHSHPKAARSYAKLRVHTRKPKLRTHIRKSIHGRNLALTSENCALTLKTPRSHSKLRPHIRNNALTSKRRALIETARSHPKIVFYPKLCAHIRSSQNSALTSETARSQLKLLTPKTTRSHPRLRVPSASIHRTAPYHALLHSELYSVACGPR